MKQAYMFWYKSDEYARTEYIYIVAVSLKQAVYFYKKYCYNRMYDYDERPIDVKPLSKDYEVGTILGNYATL